jgi:23S rRNA G2069 N7-methylase RlmK/C1962 C5-methylase RlmI
MKSRARENILNKHHPIEMNELFDNLRENGFFLFSSNSHVSDTPKKTKMLGKMR